MIKFAICDDEKIHVDIINDLIPKAMCQQSYEYTIKKFYTASELLNSEETFDILFLDICLDKGNDGIDVARLLKERQSPLIILTTSQEERAYDGYHIKAHRYVTKPIKEKIFFEAVTSAIKELIDSEKRLTLRYKQEEHYIPIQEIEVVERYFKHRIVYTKDKEYTTNQTWENILVVLPQNQFVQTHRSFYVNMKKISSAKEAEITMLSGKKITVSRGCKESFNKAFNTFLGAQL